MKTTYSTTPNARKWQATALKPFSFTRPTWSKQAENDCQKTKTNGESGKEVVFDKHLYKLTGEE